MEQVKLWSPQPKQALALSCPATELFFGGAAGGGKSDFMLIDFLQGAAKYGENWNGVLFRQTFPQLEELQKRAVQLYKPIGGEYKNYTRTWYFKNGATLKMRYMESEKDVGNYQGHQYTWIGFDELGNFPTDACWVFMISRLRSAAGVPSYIRGTANPGGVGHSWIKHRFMDGKEPNKIYEYKIDLPSGGQISTSRVFIPSRLEDNMILMRNDPSYEAKLMNLPEHLARAMRYGDWSVFAGQVFSEFSVDTHVIKPFTLNPGEWFKFCALDWGYSHPYSLGWYAVNADGRVIKYREWYGCKEGMQNVGVQEGSRELAKRAWEISVTEGVNTMVADPAIWSSNDASQSICDNFTQEGWKMIKGNNDRVNGLIVFHEMLKEQIEVGIDQDGKPVKRPMLTVFPCCTGFIRTIPMLTPNPNHMEDVDTRLEDHVYDETRYALMSEFVKSPATALRKQNGSWREKFMRQAEEYNPFASL